MAALLSLSESTPLCKNIKSKRNPTEKCTNPAKYDGFCGIHYQKPTPWTPASPENIAKRVARKNIRKRTIKETNAKLSTSAVRIQKWYRFWKPFCCLRRHGIAYYDRTTPVNDTDFFSTDKITDISGVMFFSYTDTHNHVYVFDIRSIYTLIYKAQLSGEPCQNPFNREAFSPTVIKKVKSNIAWLRKLNYPTEWAPLEPPTPEQQWRMKVVDIFGIIDSLNYYSSPDWFISLDHRGQRTFYVELHAIWTHRAGLSVDQKNTIVPNYVQRMFRHPPWAIGSQPIETLQKLNMNCMKLLITSADDKNDKILGAMYVVSALTIVSAAAREAYPWLYESVREDNVMIQHAAPRARFPELFGIGWLHDILNFPAIPPLALPPVNTITTTLAPARSPLASPSNTARSE